MTASAPLRRIMSASGRALLFSLQLLLGLLLCLYLAYKVFERQYAIDLLPAGIEPAGVLLLSAESGGREGCGAAVFRLSKQTRARVQQEGLAFLQMARQARGYDEHYYSYGPWQATPVPDSYISEGGWLSLWCAEAGPSLARRIHAAMQRPGAFYSIKDEGMLLIIPEEGLIVFGYYG